MEKDIFVISDLHIGDGSARDNFGHPDSDRPQQINLFLDYVSKQNGQLIILGDLFEFWQSSLSKTIIHNMPLLDRLAQLKTTYILGNHDSDLLHFIDKDLLNHALLRVISGPTTRTIGDKAFRFMHGHEVDPLNAGDTPSWGRMMAIFAGICEDKVGSPMLGNDPLESLLTRCGEWFLKIVANKYATAKQFITKSAKKEMTPAQNPNRAAEMLTLYAEDHKAKDYDVLVVGHTHKPGRIDSWYYNSGSWATTDNNFLRIAPNGEVRQFDWIDGRPVERNTVLVLPEAPEESST